MDSATKQLMDENMSNKKTEDVDKTDFNDREDENLDEAAGETVEEKSDAETDEDENESITAWGGSFEKLYSESMDSSLKQLLEENKSLIERNSTIAAEEVEETIAPKNEDEKFDEAVGGTVEEISDATDAIADEAENESTLERRSLEEASFDSVEDNIQDLWNINLDLIEINAPDKDSDEKSESDSWLSGHVTLYEAVGIISAEKASDVSQDTEADRSTNLDDDAKADENRSKPPQMKLETAQYLATMNLANGLPLTKTDNKNESNSSFGGARPRPPRLQSLHEDSLVRSSHQHIKDAGVKQRLGESSDDDDSKYSEAVGGVVEEASISHLISTSKPKGIRDSLVRSSHQHIKDTGVKQRLGESSDDDDSKYSEAVGGVVEEASTSHLISTSKPKGIREAMLRSSHKRIGYQQDDESSDEEDTQFSEVVEGILEELFTSYQKFEKVKSEAAVLSSDIHIEDQETDESADGDLKAVGGIMEGIFASFQKYAKDMREALARSLGEDIEERGVNLGFDDSSDDDFQFSEAIDGLVLELIAYPQLAGPMEKEINRRKINRMEGNPYTSGPISPTSSDSVENEYNNYFGGARPRSLHLQVHTEDVEVQSTVDRIDDSGVKDQLVKVPSFVILESNDLGLFDVNHQIKQIDESPSDEESKFSEAVGGAVDERFTAHQKPVSAKNEHRHVFANFEVRSSDDCDRGADDEQFTAHQKPVPKKKEDRYFEVRSSDIAEMMKSLNLGPDAINPFVDQDKILKIDESPADEDTSQQKLAPKAKGVSFTRRLARSFEALLFTSSLDIPGSIPKKPSVDKKEKKAPKPKKSRTSCLLFCFNKRNVQDPDDENDPDIMTSQSVSMSAIRGNMEDNIFHKIYRSVAVVKGYKIKIVSNTTTKDRYSYKTDGIFYAFSSSSYLKMEVLLKKKIFLRPAGQFSIFIVNPNKKTINEIEVDYSLFEMPTCSMLISRQTKFDTSINKKTATLDLRWSPRHSR